MPQLKCGERRLPAQEMGGAAFSLRASRTSAASPWAPSRGLWEGALTTWDLGGEGQEGGASGDTRLLRGVVGGEGSGDALQVGRRRHTVSGDIAGRDFKSLLGLFFLASWAVPLGQGLLVSDLCLRMHRAVRDRPHVDQLRQSPPSSFRISPPKKIFLALRLALSQPYPRQPLLCILSLKICLLWTFPTDAIIQRGLLRLSSSNNWRFGRVAACIHGSFLFTAE